MKRHGFCAGGMVERERTEMKWMNAARSVCHGTMIGITLLVMGVTSCALVFFSLPIGYEMWNGDIRPGDRIPGDAFAPTFMGAMSGVGIEVVLLVSGYLIFHTLIRRKRRTR